MRLPTSFIFCLGAILYGMNLHADYISEQIEAIERASPEKRVELMNKLKLQIAAMKEEERAEAIKALQQGGNPNAQMYRNGLQNPAGSSSRYQMNGASNPGKRQRGNQ